MRNDDLRAANQFLDRFVGQFFVGADPGFGFGLTGLGPGPDPFQFLFQNLLLGFIFARFLGDPLGLGFKP